MNKLQKILLERLQENPVTNPAVKQMMTSYTSYHLFIVATCGLLTLLFIGLAIFFFKKHKSAKKATITRKTFTVLGLFSLLNILINGFFSLVDATNAFDGTRGMMLFAKATVHDNSDLTNWISSGKASIPDGVQALINQRISFHGARFSLAFVAVIGFSLLVKMFFAKAMKTKKQTRFWLATLLLIVVELALVIMIANLQSLLNPLAAVLSGLQ